MVDAEDLKSFGHCDRVGSSPTNPTKTIGCVAQLVRALRSHRRGRRFESVIFYRSFADFATKFNNSGEGCSNLYFCASADKHRSNFCGL